MRLACFVSFFLITFTSALHAEEIKVFTTTSAEPLPKKVDARNFIGSADTCVHASLAGVQGTYKNADDNCTISNRKDNVVITVLGKGEKGEPKYDNGAAKNFRSSGNVGDGKNALADAGAQFTSQAPVIVDGKREFPVTLRANGSVQNVDKTKPITSHGRAAAHVKDPYVFTFDSAGFFEYELFLGESAIQFDPDTGEMLGNLSFFSSVDLGSNHMEYSAGFENVTLNGKSVNEDLFFLTIDAFGVIDSVDDLKIDFAPSSLLGLDQITINMVNSYIKSQFVALSGGAFGLQPGTRFALFGPGSPLAALKLDYQPGTVTYRDSLIATAEIAVPEPATGLLLAFGLFTAAGLRKKRSL